VTASESPATEVKVSSFSVSQTKGLAVDDGCWVYWSNTVIECPGHAAAAAASDGSNGGCQFDVV